MGAVVESKRTKAAKVAGVTATLTGTIGDKIDQLVALRERIRELESKAETLKGEYDGIADTLMTDLESQGVQASKGTKASCSITKTVVANVTDWDAVFAYVKKSGYFHLFQRRLTDAAYRELLEAGKKVPGVEPFTKKRLNLRAL